MSIEQQALSGLKWTGSARLIGQVLSWAVTLIVVRLLAPADYGIAAVSAAIISVISTVAELGLGASVVQAPALERETLARIAGLAIVLNWSLGAVVALSAPLAVVFFGDDVLPTRDPGLLPALRARRPLHRSGGPRVSHHELQVDRFHRPDRGPGREPGHAPARPQGRRRVGSGPRQSRGRHGPVRPLPARSHPVRPVFRLGGLRGHVAFGGTLATSRLAWHVVNQADVFTAARFLTPSAVGLYSVSLHLATLPMQRIMGIVNQVVFPTVARLQDDRPRLRERLLSGLRLLAFVSVPVMWGISAVAPEIVALALGPRWHDAVYPLQVASLLIPFKMVSAVISTAIVGVGAATLDLRNTVVNLVVLPSAFLIGVRWGVDGLVTAWALSLVVVLALTVPRSCTRLEIALLDVARSLRDPVLAGGVMYAVVLAGRAVAGRRAPRLPAGRPRARRAPPCTCPSSRS